MSAGGRGSADDDAEGDDVEVVEMCRPLTIAVRRGAAPSRPGQTGHRPGDRSARYQPRWTLSLFYFSGAWARLFGGRRGLDVGARVGVRPFPTLARVLGLPEDDPRLGDRNEPHHAWFRSVGARMAAIDLLADGRERSVARADARALPFPRGAFDFVSAGMLLGPGNPCEPPRDLRQALSEMRRVLRDGGLVHLADAGVSPLVLRAARRLGFETYVSRGSACGVPVGTFLRSAVRGWSSSPFDPLFGAPGVQPVPVPFDGDFTLGGCNLLTDARTTVNVRHSVRPPDPLSPDAPTERRPAGRCRRAAGPPARKPDRPGPQSRRGGESRRSR